MKKLALIIMMAVSMMACDKKEVKHDITNKVLKAVKAQSIQKDVFNEFKNDLDRWDFMGINGYEFYAEKGKLKSKEVLINSENIERGEKIFNQKIIAVTVDGKLIRVEYQK